MHDQPGTDRVRATLAALKAKLGSGRVLGPASPEELAELERRLERPAPDELRALLALTSGYEAFDLFGLLGKFRTLRHLIFAFKEGTFECLAEGYEIVGIFRTRKEALQKALDATPRYPDDP